MYLVDQPLACQRMGVTMNGHTADIEMLCQEFDTGIALLEEQIENLLLTRLEILTFDTRETIQRGR